MAGAELFASKEANWMLPSVSFELWHILWEPLLDAAFVELLVTTEYCSRFAHLC